MIVNLVSTHHGVPLHIEEADPQISRTLGPALAHVPNLTSIQAAVRQRSDLRPHDEHAMTQTRLFRVSPWL